MLKIEKIAVIFNQIEIGQKPDLKMPEVSGMEVLQKVKSLSPDVEVILVTAFGETETDVRPGINEC